MDVTSASRRRAPAMNPAERRAAIVQATLPLLAVHGTNVTTSQIAAAAGVAEGTVFRVFADKQELIRCCVAEAMRPEPALAQLRAIPHDLDLQQRLSRVGHALSRRLAEVGAVMHTLIATGYRFDSDQGHPAPDREGWLREAVGAVTELIGPDADALRVPPERAAHLLLSVVFSAQLAMRLRRDPASRVDPGEVDPGEVDDLIAVFLHGVLKDRPPLEGEAWRNS